LQWSALLLLINRLKEDARLSQSLLSEKPLRFTIRFTVVSIFIVATLITSLVAVGVQYYFIRGLATESAVARYSELADSSSQYLETVDKRATQVAKVLASYPGLVDGYTLNPDTLEVFAAILNSTPMLYAIYLGFDNGDFHELINLHSGERVRERFNALPEDRWVVLSITGEGDERRRTFEYYDADFQLRMQRQEPSQYDATQRPWYVQARPKVVNKTAPYLFHNLQAPGQTFSIRLSGNTAVVAVDIALSSLSEHLSSRQPAEHGEVFVYQKAGEVIASSVPGTQQQPLRPAAPLILSAEEQDWVRQHPYLRVSNETNWAPIDFAVAGQPYGYSIDYMSLISQMTGIQFEFINGFRWPELVELYRQRQLDVLQPVFDNELTRQPGVASDPFLTLPYSLVTRLGREPVTHVSQLQGWVVAIPSGWSILEVMRDHYPQIQVLEVASTRDMFDAVLDGRADAGLDITQVLRYTERQFFLEGLQYHEEVEFAPQPLPTQMRFVFHPDDHTGRDLFNRVIAQVTAGQQQALESKWFEDSLSTSVMGVVPYSQLISLAAQADNLTGLQKVTLNGVDHFIYVTSFGPDHRDDEYFAVVVPVASVLQPALDKVKWSALATAGFLLLLLPIPWIFASPIVAPVKALALENEKITRRAFAEVSVPRSRITEIDDLGQSLVSMSDAIQQHESSQLELMDSFIKLIAQAVDEKSHSTAAHCERVPELAIMLAAAAENSTTPPFAEFAFGSATAWREFKVAAWLHDCGKITTPEHIVEKGSKLELIYNRIHEIRTRFEVLWRDAEIHYWRQRAGLAADDSAALAALDQELQAAHRQLQDDFAFVASMNVGSESSQPNDLERLRQLAGTPWTRHFDNRLGLSPQEEARLTAGQAVLPCVETLLQDKAEHLVPRAATEFDPQLGIKMDVPQYLYNQGELYNLSIEYGTLTAEDRFKINEHIISTIRMLEALPLPTELARVPRYASTHHETLIGTGYPRKLSAEDLSIPERIMILADIFEALTAADRPYKKAKPVSEAIAILAKMTARQHVDADVFELFLRSGVYLQYAQRFLPDTQLDEVDIEDALRQARVVSHGR
jgi:HD-GYP domain-containing protein (c-di-GMP phosphodiesterase class II)/ABC-type amino acid transport substrate-binding protein